jgi:multidrug efflux pump subunit AcrB
MQQSELMEGIDSNYLGKIPEILITPNRKAALEFGVSVDEIGKTIQALMGSIVAGKFSKNGRRYDIKIKIADKTINSISDIKNIKVRNNRGELIPLDKVTVIEELPGLLSITREDRTRAITITSNLKSGVTQGEALDYIKSQISPKLPELYSLIESGSTKTYGEAYKSLIQVILIGLIVAYMVLASQFNSFLYPLIILSIIPFSFTGAFIALKWGNQTLNIYSMIGLVLLMGIVKKNSIILVDLAKVLKTTGLTSQEAMKEAAPIRLRPILMTSLSTIAGTLPAALTFGPGSETRIPMALSVIGGLLFATFITLYLVPVLWCQQKK